MNTPVQVPWSGEEHRLLASVLRDALVALEQGDLAWAERAAHAFDRLFAMPIHRSLLRIHNDVKQALTVLPLGEQVTQLAGHELPDAATRLDHVVEMTERAAHRTLELSEEMRRRVDALAQHGVDCEAIEPLRQLLRELQQSQAYQDVTGQVIRNVVGVVQRAERALREAMAAVGIEAMLESAPRPPTQVLGGIDAHASSQGDADDLLASLGI